MRSVRIKKLLLENFKGVRKLIVEASGGDLYIFGDNGSGKTTIADAWRWLLTGSDSTGSHTFTVKPTDVPEAERRKMSFSVEAETEIEQDGELTELILRREMREKWTRQKGSKNYIFQGNTTDYYVNKKEVTKSEYDIIISDQIVESEILDLLTDPLEFAGEVHWSERRDILLDIVNTPTLEELSERVACEELTAEVGDRSLADFIKEQDKKMRSVDKQLDRLTAQLEMEPQGYEPGLLEHIDTDISNLEESLERLRQQKAEEKAGGREVKIKHRIEEINAELAELKNSWRERSNEKLANVSITLTGLQKEKGDMENLERRLRREKEDRGEEKAELTVEWKKWSGRENESCPECGQRLPEDQLRLQKNKAAEKLKSIKEKGMAAHNRLEEIAVELRDISDNMKDLEANIGDQQAKIENIKSNRDDYSSQGRYQNLIKIKEELTESLSVERTSSSQSDIDRKIVNLKADIESLRKRRAELMAAEAHMKSLSRTREERTNLQKEYEQLAYLRDKAAAAAEMESEILEDRANELFSLAEVSLFSHTQDGSRHPACSISYRGDDFTSNLNHGHRIRVGVDIINTLSEHYGVTLPLFIDNAESITTVVDTPSQLIYLTVVNEGRWSLDGKARSVKAVRNGEKNLFIKKREVAKKGAS